MPETTMEAMPHHIVNKNFEISNVIPIQDASDRIIDTLNTIFNDLISCCGPTANYSMLVNSMGGSTKFEPNVFTRDGIRILNAIEFMSPMEEYIKDLISYVGTRVDNNAKDGTTTTMMLATALVKFFLEYRKEHQLPKLTMFQMKDAIQKLIAQIKEQLEAIAVSNLKTLTGYDTLDEMPEVECMKYAGNIAFMQAMSSSGGNMALANVMKEIFRNSPKVTWEYISHYNSTNETGESFKVDIDEHDIRIRCIQSSTVGLNKFLGTEYIAEDVDVLIVPDSLDEMAMVTEHVLQYVEEHDPERDLLIVATYFSPSIIQNVNTLNNRREHPIVLWQYSPENKIAGIGIPWELTVAAAISGIELITPDDRIDPEKNLIHAKKAHWHDSFLKLFGVIDMAENTCLHPYYLDRSKATKLYNDTLDSVLVQLDMYRNGHKIDGRALSIFVEAMNNLICVHRPKLRLGGPMHEQVANMDIAQDVEGAIMSSLKHGYVHNGIVNFEQVLLNIQQQLPKDTPAQEFTHIFIDGILTGTRAIIQHLGVERSTDQNVFRNIFANEECTLIQYSSYMELNHTEKLQTCYPVMQPIAIYTELLKRLDEVLLKMVTTDNIIVFGGVYLNKEEEHGSN